MKRSTQFLLFILMIAGGFTATAQNIIYVDLSATGANDGSSWTNAFTDLQSGLNATNSSDTVWVAAGTYVGNYSKTDGQDLVLYGGFDGTETAFSQRDWEANPTILDGNATGRVLHLEDLTSSSLLNGITVQNGFGAGAGIYSKNSDTQYSDMIIQNNDGSSGAGAGMYLDTASYAIMDNVNFYGNQGTTAGAVLVRASSHVTVTNSIYDGNSTTSFFAGGCYYFSSGAFPCSFNNVVFSNNSSGTSGGAISNQQGNTIHLYDVVFTGNSAGSYGGAINTINSTTNVYSCTFYGNHANNGGGAMGNLQASDVNVSSCVIYGNTASSGVSDFQNHNLTGNLDVAYSLYQVAISTPVGTNSTSNNNPIGQSPYFLDETNPIGTDGTWMTADDGLSLSCISPCIGVGLWNAGSGDDITGYPRTSGSVDQGAYERETAQAIYYVDLNASGNNTGLSWTHALTNFQDALNRTCEGDTIWVAQGTYFGNYTWPDDKDLVILGGFDGTETSEDQRDWETNVTILDGASSGRVFYTSNLSAAAELDGFTIQNAEAGTNNGGGMYNLNTSLTLANLVFSTNNALQGGGIYNEGAGLQSMNNVQFNQNTTTNGGGAIHTINDADLSIDAAIFYDNDAGVSGGAIYANSCEVSLSNTTLELNSSQDGGAIFTENSVDLSLLNVEFIENTATNAGGAIASIDSDVDMRQSVASQNTGEYAGALLITGDFSCGIHNSIFHDNSATVAGAIYRVSTDTNSSFTLNYSSFYNNSDGNGAGAILLAGTGNNEILNTILFGNSSVNADDDINASGYSGTISVTSSLLQDDTTGWGGFINWDASNLTPGIDPLFIDTLNPAGLDGIWMTNDDGLRLQCASPCVSSGASNVYSLIDILGNAREAIPDMGAYEKYESQGLFYVDIDATGSNNGTSWANAFTDFQDALNAGCDNDTIWVADGTYFGNYIWPDSLDLVVLGGFNGSETSNTLRDWENNVTVLDGNLQGTVLNTSSLAVTSELDGFTIQNGVGNNDGGGMYNGSSALQLRNLIFKNNSANSDGGAIYNESNSSVQCDNILFSENSAGGRGGAIFNMDSETNIAHADFYANSANNGGALYNFSGSTTMFACTLDSNQTNNDGGSCYLQSDSLFIDSCIFSLNNAINGRGGAIYTKHSTYVSIENSIFDSNSSTESGGAIYAVQMYMNIDKTVFKNNSGETGGAMYNANFECQISNSLFYQNTATDDGGALRKFGSTTSYKMWLYNCTFVENTATRGGAYFSTATGRDTLLNCIFYNNSAGSKDDIYNNSYSGTTYIAYSLTQTDLDATWGGTNTWFNNLTPGTNPLFFNSSNAIGSDGIWRTKDDGLTLTCASPCASTGTLIVGINDDIIGNMRGAAPDMGAYEKNNDQGTWYVDVNASGNNNGSTWADAFTDFQDAMEEACVNDTIWVAQGTYLGNYIWPDATDLVVLGGFTGSETTESQRDWENNVTILDGNLAGTVLYTSSLSANSALDGFTVQNGLGNNNGGGLYNDSSALQLRNLVFTNNQAISDGGAIYNESNSSIYYNNVVFSENNAGGSGGAIFNSESDGDITHSEFFGNSANNGGGLYNFSGSTTMFACTLDSNQANDSGGSCYLLNDSLFIDSCTFTQNEASNDGAGICGNDNCYVSISNSILESNSASFEGGAISGPDMDMDVSNCIFSGNSANEGGAIYMSGSSNGNVSNSVFDQNTSVQDGGAIYKYAGNANSKLWLYHSTFVSNQADKGGGMALWYRGKDTIVNCIFYNNTSTVFNSEDIHVSKNSGTTYFSNSLTQNVSSGWGLTVSWVNNLTPGTDPLFVDLNDPIGADGEWGTNDDGLRLTCASPCIATGTAIAGVPDDITGFQRDVVPDMGAYERSDNQGTWYVNVNATGNNDGTSWTDAYTDVQDAMTEACDNDTIWVAQGTYFGNYTWPDGKDLVILGGFDGSETTESQRDWNTNVTIMDGQSIGSVISISNLSNTSKIDGFTVQNGVNEGAGFRIVDASLIISNMIFDANNTGGYNGGGLYVGGASDVQVSTSVFSNNVSANGGGIYGTTTSLGNITVDSCTFSNNSATIGGALYVNYLELDLYNCILDSNNATNSGGVFYSNGTIHAEKSVFSGNYASLFGAGLISNATSVFSNCLFYDNSADAFSAGLNYNTTTADTLTNCTFYNNNGDFSGGVYFDGSDLEVSNCLFYNNSGLNGYSDIDFNSNAGTPTVGTVNITNSQLQFPPNVPSVGTVNYSNNIAYGIYPDFVDTSDVNGADDVWMTADDGLVIYGTSSASEMGIANATITEDITGVLRNDPPSIGAYETQCLYVAEPVAPALTVLDTTLYLDSTGVASLTADALVDKLTDNCGIQTITASQTDFDCNDQGTITVTVTATDFDGNSTSVDALVTIVDTIVATVVCQSTNFYLDNSGYANVDPAQIAINSWDNCALSYSTPNGFFTCNDTGNQYVEVTVTELNGNAQTCGAIISIIDTIAPVASTQDIDVYLDANGEVSINPIDLDTGSDDNCGWLYTTISPSYFTCSEVGANTITFELSDDSGNTVFAYPVVTVHDTTTPTILAQNVTVQLDASGFAQISLQDVDLGTFDNCSIASSVLSTTTFNCNDVGANNVTYTVTDVNGNISTVGIVVTVEDPIAPSLNCTSIVKELNTSGLAFVSSSELVTSFDDNCSVSLSLSQTDFDCADIGANVVTVTATDLAGNTATCDATITIVDNLAPEPVLATLDDIEATCEVNALANPFVTDNCSPVTITNDATLPITSSTTVIWTYADTSGNVSYQSQNVVISGVDASVTQVDDLNLEAVNINADAFQWVDCNNNFAAIPGEDLYVFTATQNGTYAVVVTQNGCQDTSACYTIDQVGLESLEEMSLMLAPNPANGGTVNVLTNAQIQSVTVMDAAGKVVAVPFEVSLNQLDVSGLSTGSYFVRVLLESGIITEKLIITRQ